MYSIEYDGDPSSLPPVGTRVSVTFGTKEHVGVISCLDAYEEAGKIGFARIKPVNSIVEGLDPVSLEEIELWRKVASYYLCSVGEVYKAAYPSSKVAEEETRSRVEGRKAARIEKEQARLEARIARLEERLERRLDALGRARKDEVKARLEEEIASIRAEVSSVRVSMDKAGTSDPEWHIGDAAVPVLSEAQEKACAEVKALMSARKPVLLHGVTGSGKTEIYLKLASETIAKGRNVLILVPEIALSRQLEDRMQEAFPGSLRVFHSAETVLSRHDTAAFIKSRPYVVLGTRSSIFLPHRDLGLVIVDEEHDTSYKQDNPAPRYNGREAAIMLAGVFGASVLLGSATPSLESLYNCSVGRFGLVTLTRRYFEAADSDVEVIDTIAERRKRGMVGSFSRKLIAHIGERLSLHQQVLILRERRAYSPTVQCEECGEIVKCSRCNVAMSLHRRADGSQRLVCHYCGRTIEYSGACPKCGGKLAPMGAGTQKIEEEVKALFPEARVARLDGDTARDRQFSTSVIKDFSKGAIDILVGTQIVAKGFDFSGLTLVAVLQADTILGQEDYRADEKGLHLLEQFRGRCGRRGEKGLFVIQTSQPEHPVYQTIDGTLDSQSMLARFLEERKVFGYPPYSRVIGIVIKDYSEARAGFMSSELFRAIRSSGMNSAVKVIGPYAPEVDKVSGQHIRCIRVLLPKDKALASNKAALASSVALFEKEKKYAGHISLDVDPV